MASGAPSGFGRGGRGAALLQALQQPPKKPGECAPKLGGRGAALAQAIKPKENRSLLSQASATVQPKESSTQPKAFPVPLGRGILGRGMKAEMGQQLQTPQQPSPPRPTVKPNVQETSAYSVAASSDTKEGESRLSNLEYMLKRMQTEDNVMEERGTSGETIDLSANYINVKCRNDGVYQYDVSFIPQIDSIGIRKKIIRNNEDVIGPVYAFDGAILFIPKKLNEIVNAIETFLEDRRPTDQALTKVKIKLVKAVSPEKCEFIYSIIFRKIMSILRMAQIGRHFYDPHRPAQIPQHKLEVWPGYITAIKRYAGGLMLLADVSHRVLRTETVYDIMDTLIKTDDRAAVNRAVMDKISQKIIGVTVLTRYNNKTYRIDDILWDMNPMSTFQRGREEISYHDYYRQMYNKVIRDTGQPLLLHKPKQRAGGRRQLESIILVPELCYCTGLTDEIRSDFRVMKDLATHTRITPQQRILALRKFCENVKNCEEASAELAKWGLVIDSDTIRVGGRVLPQEKIRVGDGKEQWAGDKADFSGFVTRSSVTRAIPLHTWLIVYTRSNEKEAKDFVRMMRNIGPHMGINVGEPTCVPLHNDRTDSYLKALRDHINKAVQIVVTIMPTSRDDRYNAVKKLCCVEIPVASQVINSRTIKNDKKLRSVATKIALQMNCKLGGELWSVKIPVKLIMCCGIDVYHDGASRKALSVGGFVASINSTCTQWYSRVCWQNTGQELMNGLKVCFIAALRKFHEVNNALPNKIIVFRDGVGDGDLPTVANFEAKQLSDCFQNFGQDYQPNFAVIVVQKRINTKLFAVSQNRVQFDNPPPGTVMDHVVTRRDWLDFFLVSQHVGQGTVNPTHYVVVHDHTDLGMDKLQRLTYKMTHLYYNWPGTIRVPAPCQYAHKLAYQVGQNIKKEPSLHLVDRLFFL